jgi:hypothetical protein
MGQILKYYLDELRLGRVNFCCNTWLVGYKCVEGTCPVMWCNNVKLQLSHYTPWRRLGERRYSSYSFSTSVLDGGEWSASRPGRALAPGKGPPVPIVLEAGWAPEPVCTQRVEEKSFRLCWGSNLDRPLVQPVARHYTDWATRLTM